MPLGVRPGAVTLIVAVTLLACHRDAVSNEPVHPPSSPISAGRSQLLTVITEDWDAFRGTLRRFERAADDSWTEVATPVPVVIGREGYGWGRGVHGLGAPSDRPGPVKREGDGRSPAGVFEIGSTYGYAEDQEGVALRYAQATADLRCVDDPASRYYNQIVPESGADPDWASAEHMRRVDGLYELTIVVEHNTEETEPGAGSCIFLHVWKDADHGMSGCTAMPLLALRELAQWLQPDKTVLVALPKEEYEALRASWHLP